MPRMPLLSELDSLSELNLWNQLIPGSHHASSDAGGFLVTEHYYSSQPKIKSQPKLVDLTVRGIQTSVSTDAGVFSKNGLDYATQILLETVTLRDQAVVADLGCGYGPVTAVLAALYSGASFVMLDVNERAVELARRNTSKYHSRVQAVVSDGFSKAPQDRFTDVILNPPIRAGKSVVYRLFEEAAHHLEPDGSLWIVIQKKHGAPSAEKQLTTLFDTVNVCYKKSGYFVYRCQFVK